MNSEESVLLVQMVRGGCPGMEVVEGMPQVWFAVLGDLRFVDCKAAVLHLVRQSPRYIAPADIRDEVGRIRLTRIEGAGYINPPTELADDPIRELQWRRAATKAVADGDPIPNPHVSLKPRRMPALDRVFRTIPEAAPDDAA